MRAGHYAYQRSQQIDHEPFYALLMAAMRTADSENLEKLKKAFPDVWVEFNLRYRAPGGFIGEERPLPNNMRNQGG